MKKILTLILSLIMIISVLSISQPVEAVSGSMTLRASTNTLYANQTLTVTVGLSAPVDVGSFDCILTFNSNLLRFNGGNSSIGAGINQAGNQIKIVKNAGSEVNTSTIASLSFSAVGSGDANFSVSDGIGASLALDYTFSGGASTSVKVEAGPAPTPAPTTTTTKPKQSPLTTIAPPTSKEETTTTTVTEETSETSTGTTRP
ncbi:MAG: cohesin domain-containing protein, partial [Eubacteriales bacterium]|nr:cohesin domain-containing protein [Eubacteriales bacterium]